MEEVKKKSNVSLVVLVILLVIICLGMGAYIFINKDNNKCDVKTDNAQSNNAESNSDSNITSNNSSNIQNNSETNSNKSNEVKNNIIVFNGTKALNSTEKNYTLSCQGNAGIFVTVGSTQKELTFSFTPSKVVDYYSLKWNSTKTGTNQDIIKFDKKIIDVFFGGMGQDSSGDTLFILLEDGTVEYIPIVHMFNHVQGAPVSYGKINGVTDVTKFVLSSTAGGVTTLAVKSDGSFYDMWYALKNTGNY